MVHKIFKIMVILAVFSNLFINSVFAQSNSKAPPIPTLNDVFSSIGSNKYISSTTDMWKKFTPQYQLGIVKNLINPLSGNLTNALIELVIYILPVFIVTFIVVYAVLKEINIFEQSRNLLPALSLAITLIAFGSGLLSYVVFAVSNFVAIGLLALFLALVYVGAGYYYKRKLDEWGYSHISASMLYIFVTHIPLIITAIVVISIAVYVINGSIPITGKYGFLYGVILGFLLLGIKRSWGIEMRLSGINGLIGALIGGLFGYIAGIAGLVGIGLVMVLAYMEYKRLNQPYDVIRDIAPERGEINYRMNVMKITIDFLSDLIGRYGGKDEVDLSQENINPEIEELLKNYAGITRRGKYKIDFLVKVKGDLEKEYARLEAHQQALQRIHEKAISSM